jgi:hypothetical protein
MTLWMKIGIVAAYTLLIFGMGWHIKAVFAEAAQAKILQAQIDAANLAQGRIAEQAKATEDELSIQRQKYATLNQQWSAQRAKSHTDCKLPDPALSLLKAATAAQPELPR